MITSAKEYLANLQRIRNQDIHKEILQIPSDELIYNIDLNARTVDAPVYLSTETDHIAETIFFSVDRYYETHDLANSVCIIQYINAKNKGYVYVVPIFDTETLADEGKMLIPWVIQGHATEAAGTIKYAVRFYHINEVERLNGEVEYEFDYIINTQVAQSRILKGMGEEFLDGALSPLDEVYSYEYDDDGNVIKTYITVDAWQQLYSELVDLLKEDDAETGHIKGALKLYWTVL